MTSIYIPSFYQNEFKMYFSIVLQIEDTDAGRGTPQPPSIHLHYQFQNLMSPCSQVIAFTNLSEKLTSDLEVKVNEI